MRGDKRRRRGKKSTPKKPHKKGKGRSLSPRVEVVRSYLGPRLVRAYKEKYGLSRVYSVGAILRKNLPQARHLESVRDKAQRKTFRERRRRRGQPFKIPPAITYHPSRIKGMLREYKRGRPTGKVVPVKSAKIQKSMEARKGRAGAIAAGLGITRQEASKLIRDVQAQAAKDWKKFKKSKKYKSLPVRKKRKLNLRREKAKFLDLMMDMIEAQS